jgi:hypothetical protein
MGALRHAARDKVARWRVTELSQLIADTALTQGAVHGGHRSFVRGEKWLYLQEHQCPHWDSNPDCADFKNGRAATRFRWSRLAIWAHIDCKAAILSVAGTTPVRSRFALESPPVAAFAPRRCG